MSRRPPARQGGLWGGRAGDPVPWTSQHVEGVERALAERPVVSLRALRTADEDFQRVLRSFEVRPVTNEPVD